MTNSGSDALAAGTYGYIHKVIVVAARIAPCISVSDTYGNRTIRIDTPLRVAGKDAVDNRAVAAGSAEAAAAVIAVAGAVIDGRWLSVTDHLYTNRAIVITQAVLYCAVICGVNLNTI